MRIGYRVYFYLFFRLVKSIRKMELFGVSFKLFLDSLNMKILLSELVFLSHLLKVLKGHLLSGILSLFQPCETNYEKGIL
jgi:hypothetical protein